MFTLGLFTAVFLIVLSLLSGMVLTLLIQWYFFNRYLMKLPMVTNTDEPVAELFEIPKSLLDGCFKQEPAKALNSVLQFLFQECRNSNRVRHWFRVKLRHELEELLTRTTTGKLFEAIALKELNLGTQFPNIDHIEIKHLNVNTESGLIDDLELCLDLEYKGGFQLTIDTNMRLNKTARVSVKVNKLKGLGCLKFTRLPYTHWSFSFYTDPQLQLTVESQFQGRALPQINSIIASQIRKSLKRKHTLPNYKLRYKPFFNKSEEGGVDDSPVEILSGVLDVAVLQVSRVSETTGPVFCSLAVDSMAWVEMVHSETGSYLTVDISVPKLGGSLGIRFKQEFVPDKYQVCFVVESVASYVVAEVRTGDILVSIDGKKATSLTQINKCTKQAGERVPLRLERRLKILPGPPSDDKLLDISGLRHRRGSGDKTDSDSSNSTSLSDSPAKKMMQETPDQRVIHRLSFGAEMEQQLQVFTTKEQPFSQVITFNETLRFNILPEHRFLNLSVWSKGDKNKLLGHISLPLASVCISSVGHHIDTYFLLPPLPHLINSSNHPLSSHTGFEPCLCYGDVLLSTCFTVSQMPVIATTHLPPTTSLASLSPPSNPHDFERTHFDRATQCGFCFKKIWLKDAFRCKGCNMTCHKKCVSKCLAVSTCSRFSPQPEIVTTTVEDSDSKPEQTSLAESGMLFSLESEEGDEVTVALEQLLSRPQDEGLMDQAKATGPQLFADLAPEARKQRIDSVIAKLNDLMDEERKTQSRLGKEEKASSSSEDKTRAAYLMAKSEEKMSALSVLMLHCCAGLQDSHDTHTPVT